MARGDLTDEQWALIEPHLPIAAVGPISDLRNFSAVMWRSRTGSRLRLSAPMLTFADFAGLSRF